MPSAKKEFYQHTIDSVKQHVMMKCEPWDSDAINQHFRDMTAVFLESLQPPKS